MRENVLVNEDFFISPALREVDETLGEEIKLNEQFQTFINNFRTTYEGSIAETNQEGCKLCEIFLPFIYILSHNMYMSLLYVFVVIPNDEIDLVPAGPSFQELVRLFSNDFDSSGRTEKADNLLQLMKSVYACILEFY